MINSINSILNKSKLMDEEQIVRAINKVDEAIGIGKELEDENLINKLSTLKKSLKKELIKKRGYYELVAKLKAYGVDCGILAIGNPRQGEKIILEKIYSLPLEDLKNISETVHRAWVATFHYEEIHGSLDRISFRVQELIKKKERLEKLLSSI